MALLTHAAEPGGVVLGSLTVLSVVPGEGLRGSRDERLAGPGLRVDGGCAADPLPIRCSRRYAEHR
jgi:hypothetical protein